MKQTEIKRLSHELRLYGIHENFERRLTLASSEGQTGEELLIRLLEDEKQYNELKKTIKDDIEIEFCSVSRFINGEIVDEMIVDNGPEIDSAGFSKEDR